MMRWLAALPLAVAACAAQPLPDTAILPFAAFGTMDNDVAAANLAAWAFAAPERTANNPGDAARAVAGLDYLAGELSSNPRWLMVSPLTKQDMLQARREVRQVLEIGPDAPSQVVVTSLLRFAAEWQAGNQAVALQALSVRGFTLAPQATVRRLGSLPYIRSANVGSMDAANQMLSGDNLFRRS